MWFIYRDGWFYKGLCVTFIGFGSESNLLHSGQTAPCKSDEALSSLHTLLKKCLFVWIVFCSWSYFSGRQRTNMQTDLLYFDKPKSSIPQFVLMSSICLNIQMSKQVLPIKSLFTVTGTAGNCPFILSRPSVTPVFYIVVRPNIRSKHQTIKTKDLRMKN